MPETNDLDTLLGRDFLTWLWHMSESAPEAFKSLAGGSVSISIDKRVTVESPDNESREVSVVSGDGSPLNDARHGLLQGKKVSSAVIGLEKNGLEFQLGLKASDFSIRGLKIPKIESAQDDPDAVLLERIFLMESVAEALDSIFASFIKLRLSSQWPEEARKISAWMRPAE